MNRILFVIAVLVFPALVSCDDLGRRFMKTFSRKYETDGKVLGAKPLFLGPDSTRTKISVNLQEVVRVKEPTDIQFPPKESPFMFLLEKSGSIVLFDRKEKKQRVLHTWDVLTDSEEGLLGLAFHPEFPTKPLLYLNYVKQIQKKDYTRIVEVTISNPQKFDSMKVEAERVLLEVEQPYPNHNAGQLVFGPDKYLYIGLGDGGWRADPKNNGQNPNTLLGSMLRIDPTPSERLAYTIPKSNPFYGKPGFAPEVFAYGIRNPWRFHFAPDGRLIMADVGQDKYEELDFVESGKNYGWNQTEGFHCFLDGCEISKYASPFFEYTRDEGQSITGGYVYLGKNIPSLSGKYVYGDFIQGKIWAISLPKTGEVLSKESVISLGKWNILIPTFGRDSDGELFVADYQTGTIFKLVPGNE